MNFRGSSWLILLLVVLSTRAALAQSFTNSSLNGKYFFVQLLITTNPNTGQPTTVSNLGGTLTFKGDGSFIYSGSLGTNAATASASSGNGSYLVSADGSVTFTNPIRMDLIINGHLSADQGVVLGSTTEDTKDHTGDLFIAVKAPPGGMSNTVLNGSYHGSTMAFPNGALQSLSSSFVSLATTGNGQLTVVVAGHEADQFGMNVVQTPSNATYSISADGTGTANFGPSTSSSLLNGAKSIFVSGDGNYILGFSTSAGGRDIFLATRDFSSSASIASLNGRYWIAELDYDDFQHNLSSASGAFLADGKRSNLLSERLNGAFSYSAIYSDFVYASSIGQFVRLSEGGLINMALGAPAAGSTSANAMLGAQIDLTGFQTTYYGLFFAVLAPTFSDSPGTVFLNPSGVVNDASFAPTPNPIAAGEITSLFGSGLSAVIDKPTTVPLPTSDNGVSVTVNGIAAPLFYISPAQIVVQIPIQVAGSNSVTLQVTNNGQRSNAVTVPLAAGDPGIFTWADSSSPNHGAVLHGNGALVTPSNPAARGETVEVFATGLGALIPPLPTNTANPSTPPAAASDKSVTILFDGEPATAVVFAGGAPTYIGLNQINVVVPMDATTGPDVPIQIQSSWGFSDVADIAIQ